MYGFWLPNDPRGSWSDFVGAWDLFRYGPATKTRKRRSVAASAHNHSNRLAAKGALKYPAVLLNGEQARAVARGFADYLRTSRAVIHACAILPDHVHLVLSNPGMLVEQLVIQLKASATRRLEQEGIHPLAIYNHPGHRVPKCFARGEWKVYLDQPDVARAIDYVDENPLKEGKKRQQWTFISPYKCY